MAARSFCCFIGFSRMSSKVPRWNVQIQEIPQTEGRECGQPAWLAILPSMRRPQHFPTYGIAQSFSGRFLHSRPIYGLARQNASPSHDCSQWHTDTPTLAYRCGGSTGISPVSRLTGRRKPSGTSMHAHYSRHICMLCCRTGRYSKQLSNSHVTV